MNDKVLDYLMSKVESEKHKHDYARSDSRGKLDFEGSMDFEDRARKDYADKDYADKDYASKDYRRRSRDMGSHHGMRLSKTDIHRWKRMLENDDGTDGPHYDMEHILSAADKLGIHFEDYDEKEFCMAVNMMYSDYCKVVKKYVSSDKELMFLAELAKAFLEDEDGPEPYEKLALYFHCIVDA